MSRPAVKVSTRTRTSSKIQKAGLGVGAEAGRGRDDAQRDGGQVHRGGEVVELFDHRFGGGYEAVEGLFGEQEDESVIAFVQDVLAVHADLVGLRGVVGQVMGARPVGHDRLGVGGCLQQAGDDPVFVGAQQLCSFVEGYGGVLQAAQAGAGVAPPVSVGRVDGAHLHDEVGHLVFGAARAGPGADVGVGQALATVLRAGDLGEMEVGRFGELPPRETRVEADLTKTVAERFACSSFLRGHGGSVGW